MKTNSFFTVLVFFILFGLGLATALSMYRTSANTDSIWIAISSFVVALFVSSTINIADQGEKVVIMRLGHFHSIKGSGIFFILPIIDSVSYRIDTRTITTTLIAERTLTKDTVPIDIEAVISWKVVNSKKAAFEVVDYKSAVNNTLQTTMHDVIEKTMLSDILDSKKKIINQLHNMINERTEPWGINVISVKVKDVSIHHAMEDAI